MITYYTDGSASPNPGPGGYAVIRDSKPYIIGGEPLKETTNIRMEGLAIKTALEDAAGAECQIYTDSEFWINVITKWAPGWEANGWKKKGGEIKNLDIVQAVYPLYKDSQATLTWVRGHEGDEGNELADEWANIARQKHVTAPEKVEEDDQPKDPVSVAKIHFTAGRALQLASLHDGEPRVNSVYFIASDDNKSVYWMSEPRRRHSQDIVKDSRVAGAVAVKVDYPVMGLQFSGNASEVTDLDEIKEVAAKYSKKYGGFASDLHARYIAGTNVTRVYKITVTNLEIFDDVNFPGEEPVEVPLG